MDSSENRATDNPGLYATDMPSSDLIDIADGQHGDSDISFNKQEDTTSSDPESHPTESGAGYFDGSVQTCRDVIQTLLREKGMEDQIPHYAIYMADSSGQERALKMDERPREILERLNAAGTYPLIVRKRMSDEVTPPPGTPPQDQDFSYQGESDGMGPPQDSRPGAGPPMQDDPINDEAPKSRPPLDSFAGEPSVAPRESPGAFEQDMGQLEQYGRGNCLPGPSAFDESSTALQPAKWEEPWSPPRQLKAEFDSLESSLEDSADP